MTGRRGVTILRHACTIAEASGAPVCNVQAIPTLRTGTMLKEDRSINGMLDLRSANPATAHRDTDHAQYPSSVRPALPRRLAPWLVLVTLLSLTAMRTNTAHADTVVSSTATVTSPDGLNLRSAPNTSASV